MLPSAGLFGHHNSITTNEIIEGGVPAAMLTLISSSELLCAGLLGHHNSITANEIIEGGVLAAMLTLISSYKLNGVLEGVSMPSTSFSSCALRSKVIQGVRASVCRVVGASQQHHNQRDH